MIIVGWPGGEADATIPSTVSTLANTEIDQFHVSVGSDQQIVLA